MVIMRFRLQPTPKKYTMTKMNTEINNLKNINNLKIKPTVKSSAFNNSSFLE